jgi:hypothetical protein
MTSQLPLTGLSLVGVADTLSPTLADQLPQSGSNLAPEAASAGTPASETGSLPLGLGGMLGGSMASAAQKIGSLSGLRWTRITAFIIGLMLIAGGIFALKPVRETVSKAVEAGRKVAETAAVAA